MLFLLCFINISLSPKHICRELLELDQEPRGDDEAFGGQLTTISRSGRLDEEDAPSRYELNIDFDNRWHEHLLLPDIQVQSTNESLDHPSVEPGLACVKPLIRARCGWVGVIKLCIRLDAFTPEPSLHHLRFRVEQRLENTSGSVEIVALGHAIVCPLHSRRLYDRMEREVASTKLHSGSIIPIRWSSQFHIPLQIKTIKIHIFPCTTLD